MKIIANKKLLVSIIVFFFLFISLTYCQASLVDGIPCATEGKCELSDFMKIAINVANWILGITGSLALAFFIYGGVMFLISAGSPEMVTKAKQIIIGAVIGLVIVFASYTIIRFVFQAAGLNWQGKIEAPKPAEETPGPVETPFEDGNCPGGICG